jgi:hypothetical protein
MLMMFSPAKVHEIILFALMQHSFVYYCSNCPPRDCLWQKKMPLGAFNKLRASASYLFSKKVYACK